MDTTGETQVYLTDPDCRSMATTSKQPRVATEMALHVLAYNMMRGMTIIGVPHLMEAMRA